MLLRFADKVRSLTKETPFWESLGVYFELWPVIRRLRDTDTKANHTRPQRGISDAEDDLTTRLGNGCLLDERSEDEIDSDGDNALLGEEAGEDDRIFIFLARRRPGTSFTRSRESGETSRRLADLPPDLMKGKDGQFEEFLMLHSMQTQDW